MNRFFETHRQAALLIMMGLLVGPFLWVLKPFWITIVLGLIFSVALEPAHTWLERKMKGHSRWALITLLTGVTVLFVFPFILVLIKGSQILVKQLKRFSDAESIYKLKAYQATLLEKLDLLKEYGIDPQDLEHYVWTTLEKAGTFTTSMLGNTISQIPEMLLLIFVLLLSIYSFLSMKYTFSKSLQESRWLSSEGRISLVIAFKNSCRSVIVSSFGTGFAQALLTTIGAMIFTDHDPILIFFITLLLSFIPVIGAGPVSVVLAIIEFIQGNWGAGIGLLIFGGITGVLDNILRPLLVAGSTTVPPIWALLCTIGAIIVFGLPGLFIGPLIAALTVDLLPLLAEEYKRKPDFNI